VYAYESGGHISALEWDGGRAEALYGRYGPVYWAFTSPAAAEDPSGNAAAESAGEDGDAASEEDGPPSETGERRYRLQWDEKGLLVRIYGSGTDFRYDYDFDEKGNWTRRRETAWEEAFGVFVPVSRTETEREISYAPDVPEE
jgi:hypothetical protein